MAEAECKLCTRCCNCIWTNDHHQACEVVYTPVSASITMEHEREHHAPLNIDIALRGNEIQVKRLFKDIVAPQVNAEAARILDQWLLNKDDGELPSDIPRLWK